MKTKILALLFILGFTVTALGTGDVAYAGLFDNAKNEACAGARLENNPSNCATTDTSGLDKTIEAVINILSVIVGIVAVIMIILNGFKFITSGGDSNKVSSAKTGIIYAVVGIIIVALAQFIVKFVIAKV